MKPRHLNILIVILYSLAALSLLGIGSYRQKLQQHKEQHTQEQGNVQRGEQDVPTDNAEDLQTISDSSIATREVLQDKLTVWQLVALSLFGLASLLMVLKDKILKKPTPQEQNTH